MTVNLSSLPVELTYRILDNLDEITIFTSFYNVCTRLNSIINSYRRYHVKRNFVFSSNKKDLYRLVVG